MLVGMKELIINARREKYAVGAFNISCLENIIAVMNAAEKARQPVILQYAEAHKTYIPIEVISPIMISFAKKASIPVAVHFDHGTSFESCLQAMKLGFGSVMYDASDKPFEVNTRETAEVVRVAHAMGISVEAELGKMLNSDVGLGESVKARLSDDFDDPDDFCTSPALAKIFLEKTGVDALAISFGTMHGVYTKAPSLNFKRINEISDEIDIPLVMHGGSGVPEEDFRKAINNGISKINYYTYMAMAGGDAVADYVNHNQNKKIFFHDISKCAIEAMQNNVEYAIHIFSNRLASDK